MQINAVDWSKFIYLTSLYLIIISTQIIVIVDTTEPVTSIPSRQMCSKIQSMLSYGKYQTYQMSSNITYVSRVYAQNFLAYSSLEDILIFIEPKHQLHVYNAQTIHLIVSLITTNVVYVTSCISLTTNDRHDLFFIYETRLQPNILSIRVCQIQFDIFNLNFQEKKCIQTLTIRCDRPDIRINGFTIKRDHIGTNKSLLFISTDIGLIYTIFDTNNGSLIRESIILNDTLNEGSVVVTSSGIIYYANKQEHTIHEIYVTRDFRIRYGKIIKSNAIKSPFGLITDECNHLYISTKSMILVMFIQTYTTIRSVFSKASDLPITIERLNSTTYVYATVKKYSGKIPPIWMFNFLSFSDTDKTTVTTRIPAIKMKAKLDTTNKPSSLSISESLRYTDFTSTPAMSEQRTTDHTTLHSLSTEHSTSISSNEVHNNSSDDNLHFDYSSLPNENHLTTTLSTTDYDDKYTQQTSEETSTFSSSLSTEDSTEYLYSSILTSTPLETTLITSPFHVTKSSFLSSERTTNVDSTLSSYEPLTIEEQSTMTELNTIHYSDQSFSSLDTTESTQLPSTILAKTLSTDVESTSLDMTLARTSEYLSYSSIPHLSTSFDQSTSQINDVITSTIAFETTSLQDQFHSSTLETPTENVNDDQSQMITDSSINSIQTSTLFMTTTNFIDKEMEDRISPMLVKVNVSSTPDPSSLFDVSSTIFTPSLSFQSPSSSHPSLAHSSTTSTKLNQLLSSKHFSVATTTTSDPSTTLSSSINTILTTDSATTSDTTEQSLMTTFSDESSTLLILTTDNKETVAITDSLPFETTPVSSTTTEYPDDYTSTKTSLEIASTTSSNVYDFTTAQPTLVVTHTKPRSSRLTRRTSKSTTSSTTTSTTRTIDSYRTRKQKTTRLKSESSTTTVAQTTSTYTQSLTSSPIFIWYSKLNSLQQQQMIVIKPTINTNSSNTLLSNELLNVLFNSTTNSTEKLIFFNLSDLPPSSWNLSLHTNESIFLDIILPSLSPPLNPNSTTNLTFTNVEANRFTTNIIGSPINLQVDQIQTKQFSLAMDLTNNQSNQSLSDIVIGHIRSEKFELNITKSDNMNVHVKQVDSETAELFFDSKFCTNESNLQINLNLSKNGSLRYGDRPPLRIGPVFTRVHMLKQSCHLEQPFTLFFDICQGQNPCLNGGTCKSQIPDYDNPSYSQKESSQINYHCICPARISGKHCDELQYPFGYCINNGSLISIFDNFINKSIEQCLCAQGFQGIHCEDNTDDCINIDCSNHGVCKDGINTYSCSCFSGFYGDQCEQKNVETIVLQVANKSFATIAILLIAGIAGLVVASDIHTYLTRKKQKSSNRLISKLPRATSELFENSVLLLGFGDAPIEMSDLSTIDRKRKTSTTSTIKQRPKDIRKQSSYKRISERRYRYIKTLEKPSSKRSLFSNPAYETIL